MTKHEFTWDRESETHMERRKRILESHPEVREFMGFDPRTKWICLFLVAIQTWLASLAPRMHWAVYCGVAYFIGATITQALFLAVHECSHNLLFASGRHNRRFSVFLNFPIGVPFSIAFRHYHLDHHAHQGVDGIDTDLPTDAELRYVRGPFAKFLWISFQIVFYAVRPLVCGKRPVPMSVDLLFNVCSQLAFDVILWKTYGPGALGYMMVCVLLAGGLHPCAGHFLSEHYLLAEASDTVDTKGDRDGGFQETFSYYGILNGLTWNVGYHNEHHDFPNVPGTRLPRITKSAPEFYLSLDTCPSWTGILWQYVTDSRCGPWKRSKRHRE